MENQLHRPIWNDGVSLWNPFPWKLQRPVLHDKVSQVIAGREDGSGHGDFDKKKQLANHPILLLTQDTSLQATIELLYGYLPGNCQYLQSRILYRNTLATWRRKDSFLLPDEWIFAQGREGIFCPMKDDFHIGEVGNPVGGLELDLISVK